MVEKDLVIYPTICIWVNDSWGDWGWDRQWTFTVFFLQIAHLVIDSVHNLLMAAVNEIMTRVTRQRSLQTGFINIRVPEMSWSTSRYLFEALISKTAPTGFKKLCFCKSFASSLFFSFFFRGNLCSAYFECVVLVNWIWYLAAQGCGRMG